MLTRVCDVSRDGEAEGLHAAAVPMIGGMVSSTVLTLIVIPAIYGLVKGWRLPRTAAAPVTVMSDRRDHALSDRPAE